MARVVRSTGPLPSGSVVPGRSRPAHSRSVAYGTRCGDGGAVHRRRRGHCAGPCRPVPRPGHRPPAGTGIPRRPRAWAASSLRGFRCKPSPLDRPRRGRRRVRRRPRPRLPRAQGRRRGRAPAHGYRFAHQLRVGHARRPPHRRHALGTGGRVRRDSGGDRSDRHPAAAAPCSPGAALGRVPEVGGHRQRSGRSHSDRHRHRDPGRLGSPVGRTSRDRPSAAPCRGSGGSSHPGCRLCISGRLGLQTGSRLRDPEDARAPGARPRRPCRAEPPDARGRADRRDRVRHRAGQPPRPRHRGAAAVQGSPRRPPGLLPVRRPHGRPEPRGPRQVVLADPGVDGRDAVRGATGVDLAGDLAQRPDVARAPVRRLDRPARHRGGGGRRTGRPEAERGGLRRRRPDPADGVRRHRRDGVRPRLLACAARASAWALGRGRRGAP